VARNNVTYEHKLRIFSLRYIYSYSINEIDEIGCTFFLFRNKLNSFLHLSVDHANAMQDEKTH
jgi:hypothetical protein